MSAQHDNQEIRPLQHEADRVKPLPKVSVLGYITILFAVAFLLLLLSYFMQQRSSEAVISGLKESVSAMQSIENLQSENDTLAAQVESLEDALEQKSDEQAAARRTSANLELQVCAMDWLREIQSLYTKKYYKAARAMIAEFEGTGLAEHLPGYSLHSYDGVDVLSPLEQYGNILDALN